MEGRRIKKMMSPINPKIEDLKKLEKIIHDLVQKVRVYQKRYGQEYVGGKPLQFIINEIEELGINI